ncbi:hypothetical protein CK203_078690 [Vitis vinifera]|uniref:KANL3/Tex30 alpha/beta hydrolase-like domain-containing protein n=1 Tax=Vitis vinifera TaxID=29760 RepID=A0A438E622_VITVI|nr:hypothetical protein CK203_078690 [Vitis vinifera]
MASSPPSKRRRKNSSKEDDTNGSSSSSPEKMTPVLVFAHGAGAPSSSDWMVRWKDMMGKAMHAVEVVTFDYPYISGGKRRAPPKAEKLVEFHSDIVKMTLAKYPGHPLILAGKSMGSSYTIFQGMSGTIRDETLLQLKVPIMFVQGSKDGLCPLEKLEAVRKKMKSLNELHVIEGGDHSFKIAKKHLNSEGTTQAEAEDHAVQAIAAFVSKALAGR